MFVSADKLLGSVPVNRLPDKLKQCISVSRSKLPGSVPAMPFPSKMTVMIEPSLQFTTRFAGPSFGLQEHGSWRFPLQYVQPVPLVESNSSCQAAHCPASRDEDEPIHGSWPHQHQSCAKQSLCDIVGAQTLLLGRQPVHAAALHCAMHVALSSAAGIENTVAIMKT
jgi:hypothetical protein